MNKKILIVDDDPDILDLIDSRLQSAGFTTDVGLDAKSAMKKIQDNTPDLVILDIMMPGIDGTKLCWVLKQGKKYGSIPIIIISAKKSSDVQKNAEQVGADAFISKPFEAEVLLGKIKELLSG